MPQVVKKLKAVSGLKLGATQGMKRAIPATTPSKKDLSRLELPMGIDVQPDDLEAYTYLFFGERKIGKSQISAQFRNPFFLMFEPGGRSLGARQCSVGSWEELGRYVDLLETSPGYCDTIVIDPGHRCYEQCYNFKMREFGIAHPRDLEGWEPSLMWKSIEQEFQLMHERIFSLNKAVVITAHTEVKEFKRKDGSTTSKLTMQLGAQALRFYAAVVDVIAYMHYGASGERIITIRGNEYLEAGSRICDHFMYPDGEEITDIPMGSNPRVAYQNFVRAFHNQLPRGKEGENTEQTVAQSGARLQTVRKGGLKKIKR